MKKIRNNIFETNSSSSHSLIIEEFKKDIQIVDGVLNLNDLKDYSIEVYNRADIEIIYCDTKNKKLAVAFAVLFSERDDKKLIEYLKLKYDIKEIIGSFYTDSEIDIHNLIDNIDNSSTIILVFVSD